MSANAPKMSLRNIKIGHKIIGAFTLIVLTMVVVSVLIFANNGFVQKTTNRVINDMTDAVEMDQILQYANAQQTAIRGLLITGDVGYIDAYRAAAQRFDAAMDAIMEDAGGQPGRAENLEAMDAIMTKWRTGFAEQQIGLVGHPLTIDQARALEVTGESSELFEQLAAIADSIKADIRSNVEAAQSTLHGANIRMSVVIIAGAVVSLLLAAAFGILLTRGIASPINEITGAMNRLATGDKDTSIPALGRGDEVGEMAHALETFKNAINEAERLATEQAEMQRKAAEDQARNAKAQAGAEADAAREREAAARKQAEAQAVEAERAERLRELTGRFEQEISTVLDAVSTAARQLEQTASTMSAVATQSSNQSRTVASASEEASGNVSTVAAAAEELSASIDEIGKRVHASTQAIDEVNEKTETADQKISTLTDASNRIGDIVGVIDEIAERTNLLSLNATIEAQRAGEAGKGFAVVAHEVKELASQTGQATQEVTTQINGIQAATSDAAQALSDIKAAISKVTEISTAIAAAIEEQAVATQEIARNVDQAASGTQEVAENIVEVEKAANDTGTSAGEVLEASKGLNVQSGKIRDFINDFLGNVRSA